MRYYFVVLLLLLLASCTQRVTAPEQAFVTPTTKPAVDLPNSVGVSKISFSSYVNHPRDYQDQNLVLTGYLRSGLPSGETTGATQYFLVDDYGLRVRLRNYDRYVFLFNIPSNTTYTINGTWQKEYYGYGLFVNTIR